MSGVFNGIPYEEGSIMDAMVKMKKKVDKINGGKTGCILSDDGLRAAHGQSNSPSVEGRVWELSVPASGLVDHTENLGQCEDGYRPGVDRNSHRMDAHKEIGHG